MLKLLLALLFVFVAQVRLWAATGVKPVNVLMIAVDDLKPTLGCYGDTMVVSPNIDWLASQGTVFFNNYCQQAVCAPSRASLLTGLRPDRSGVWDLREYAGLRRRNPNVVTLPQYFRQHGYETAAVGKVFDLRSVDKQHDAASWSVPYRPARGKRWLRATEKVSTEIDDAPDSAFVDGHILADGLDLLDQLARGDKPFFLAVGFKKPHLPFVAPKVDWDRYPRALIPLAPFQEHAANAPEWAFQPGWELRHYVDIPKKGRIPDDKQRELINGYYACVSHVDRLIGRLLRRLDELNLRDNTVIVLWGDHGWHLGDHLMWCKHTNFEQATRAPLIIAAPGFPKGQVAHTMSEFVDIFPTLCELTNLPVPDNLDGVSLVPALQDSAAEVKPYAVSQFHRVADGVKVEGYAVRTKRYRYVEWLKRDIRLTQEYDTTNVVANELYDYKIDPLETVSRAPLPEYREVVTQFRQILRDYFEKMKKKAESDLPSPQGSNLLQNPGFEFGLGGWQAKGSMLAVVESPVHSGQYALRVTGRQKDWAGAYQDVTGTLQAHGPGTYAVTGYFRSLTDSSVQAKLKVRLTAGGQVQHLGAIGTMDSSGWHLVTDTLRLTWQGKLDEALLSVQTAGGYTGDFFVDDVSLTFLGPTAVSQRDVNGRRLPDAFGLVNYPNPFNGQTTIRFWLDALAPVRLAIFDLAGREVRRLVDKSVPPGEHRAVWDGTDRERAPVTSGCYLAVLRAGETRHVRKMVLLR
ncbi:MAG: sulfatase-like hydrolase/transferase [Calditrichaeota bacterium]|nr:sulfatase-like hydrolase/transferase [Calditrichota bacterium]